MAMAANRGASRRAAALGSRAQASATAEEAERNKKRRDTAQQRALAAPPRPPVAESRYEKLEVIGSGAYGVVYRALDRRTGETVAMKCLHSTEKFGDDCRLDFIFGCEVSALEACLGLPSVVQLRDYCRRDPHTGEQAFIVMEFVGSSLKDFMKDENNGVTRRHQEHEVRRLVRQLLTGAAGMHRVGLMHRDIKPDNVLVDDHGDLKLCDLGIARAFSDEPPFTNPVVARRYRAPELLVGCTDYDSRIDAWAVGCVMAELLAGGAPFRGDNAKEQLGEVLNLLGAGDIREWRRCPDRLPGGCGPTSFLRDLFPSPEMDSTMMIAGRPTLSEAGFEVLSGLLRCNPEKRMSPARALMHRWFQQEASSALK